MKWIETLINTTQADTDYVCAVVMDCGIEGIEIVDTAQMHSFIEENPLKWDYVDEDLLAQSVEGVMVRFYVPDDDHGRAILSKVHEELALLGGIVAEITTTSGLDDEVWLEEWRKHYKPFRVGDNIIIRPVWEDYEALEGDVVFSIEPGHVFGTGLHQSTTLCIKRLEKLSCGGASILDVGCGSGILSIVGLMLGAKSALGIDTDPAAVSVAYDNARLNGVSGYTVLSGNFFEDEELFQRVMGVQYDIILANIVADVIIRLAHFVPMALKPGGSFVSSGIIRERLSDVEQALTDAGLTIAAIDFDEGWVSIWATA